MAAAFHELTALDAAKAIKTGQMTVRAYAAGLISHIQAHENQVQAWQHLDPERVLAEADRLDARPDLAELPLSGVAVGVKDIIDTADMPTENGTVLDAGRQPASDAAVVRLLREAGALIMGKTVTTELAYMQPSRTRNPGNLEHSPGGSSAGSAAAVAAGMVPIALGSQTNGSVIRPASFCGLYALKPTNGLFSTESVLEEAPTFDTVGVLARSLADVAAVAQVLAKGGVKASGVPNYLQAAREPLPAARFAFVKTPAWSLADETTKKAFVDTAAELGPACEELQLPPAFDRALALHRTIMFAEIALNFRRYYEGGRNLLSPIMRETIEAGRAIGAVDYAEALREREHLYRRLEALLEPYDAIITPSAVGTAPKGFETTGNPAFCTLWTYLGTPALNLPLLMFGGMPLGVQLTGQRFQEQRLFRAALTLFNAHS